MGLNSVTLLFISVVLQQLSSKKNPCIACDPNPTALCAPSQPLPSQPPASSQLVETSHQHGSCSKQEDQKEEEGEKEKKCSLIKYRLKKNPFFKTPVNKSISDEWLESGAPKRTRNKHNVSFGESILLKD